MVVNMFTAYTAWLWGFMHSTDGGLSTHGGEAEWSYAREGWQAWKRQCWGFDTVAGQSFSFIDGEQNAWEQQRNADATFNDHFERANKKIKEADLITDVVVGCFLTEDLAGKIGYGGYNFKKSLFLFLTSRFPAISLQK